MDLLLTRGDAPDFLPLAGVSLAAGIALTLLLPPVGAAGPVLSLTGLAVWTALLARRGEGWAWWAATTFLGVGMVLGGGVVPSDRTEGTGHFREEETCRVEGRIVGFPSSWDGGRSLTLELARVEAAGTARRSRGRMRLHLYGNLPREPRPGDLVRAEVSPWRPRGRRFPGDTDRRLLLAGEGIAHVASAAAGARCLVTPGTVPPHLRWAVAFREAAREVFARAPPPAGGLLAALVAGQRHLVPGETEEAFRAAGLTHLLSISGLHVSLAALAIYHLLLLVLRRASWLTSRMDVRRPALLLASPAVVFYTQVAGYQVPAVRSCLMALAVTAGAVLVRRAGAGHALWLAALLILLHDPSSLATPSFQLSFAAVWSILRVARRWPGLVTVASGGSLLRRLGRWITALAAVSTAAFAGTAALASFHFSEFSLWGIPTGVVAVPLTGVAILPLGLAAGAAAPFHPGLAAVLAAPAGWGCLLVAALADFCRDHPWLRSGPLHATPLVAAAWFLLLWALTRPGSARSKGRWLTALTGGVLLVGGIALAAIPERGTRIFFLDVGQGDATFLDGGPGGRILVDGGPAGEHGDKGRTVVAPFLGCLNVRRLDLCLLTHDHPDHSGGLPAVLEGRRTGIFGCGEVPSFLGPEAGERSAIRRVERVELIRGGWRRRFGDLALLVPPGAGEGGPDGEGGINDRSLVVVARDGEGGGAVLAADAGSAVLERLADVPAGELPEGALLKVPHHGSRHSLSPSFLRRVHPPLAVISVGRNSFGHPSPLVTAELERLGATVLATRRGGTVLVRRVGGAWEVTCWEGRERGPSPLGFTHWLVRGY
jgi:competence protein ComEC